MNQKTDGPEISVVIPTYNRSDVLKDCLQALGAQTLPAREFETIIIDDGSTDDTAAVIASSKHHYSYAIDLIQQENQGPATARNAGIHRARGEIILFMGDDIIAAPDLLYRHRVSHRTHNNLFDAVLGFVTWDPARPITPFMRWLENGGPQFNYTGIKGDRANYGFFYTCNLSIKRRFLLENGMFDEDFRHAAYEDTELAYRLEQCGMILHYNAEAKAWHRHATTFTTSLKRMRIVGQAAARVERKHPEIRFIGEFEKAASRTPHRSRFWPVLQSLLAPLPRLPWVSQRIDWRAHEFYWKRLAQRAVEGYQTAQHALRKEA